jgi:hypothetical protein
MKFVVAYNVRSCANLCSLTKVFGEHRNLPNVKELQRRRTVKSDKTNLLHGHVGQKGHDVA